MLPNLICANSGIKCAQIKPFNKTLKDWIILYCYPHGCISELSRPINVLALVEIKSLGLITGY